MALRGTASLASTICITSPSLSSRFWVLKSLTDPSQITLMTWALTRVDLSSSDDKAGIAQ